MSRKKIALITINPTEEPQQRIMDGVFNKCAAYDYDVVVVTPFVHITHFFKNELHGELNIYELINFDLFDGVIITPIPMQEEQIDTLTNRLLEKVQRECKVPVVSVNLKFGDYDVVYSDENQAMTYMTEHVIKKHYCKKIDVLTGPKDFPISGQRVDCVRKVMESNGLMLKAENIHYGDFWYTSGEQLGAKYVSGECELPEAVVCSSDHMAIGLTNYLIENDIRVPEDVIITGNGGAREAYLNLPTITTFDSDESYTGEAAVDLLHEKIENTRRTGRKKTAGLENVCIGGSCGCKENIKKIRLKIRNSMYTSQYSAKQNNPTWGISLTDLMESYILEQLTATTDAESCLNKIYESIYLLKPYGYFYLCLNNDWLDEELDITEGYKERVNMAIYSDMAKKLHGYINHVFFGKERERTFDVRQMLPALSEDFDTPQVFYFTPIHFGEKSIGYTVLQNELSSKVRLSVVYHNYIRYITNALEMSRAKDHVINLSEHDLMTGLYNRRGMARLLDRLRKKMQKDGSETLNWLAIVIDMNNLKLINDTKGHEVGDMGICTIARVATEVAPDKFLCVRAGGDEFYIIGLGAYEKKDGEKIISEFRSRLHQANETIALDIEISAAAGCAVMPVREGEGFDAVLDEADVAMYVDKRSMKRR